MPLILETNYQKKIGLPQFSSHQFSVTLRTEINDLGAVQTESQRLYGLLQKAVDDSLHQVGFLPGNDRPGASRRTASNGHENWGCSDKQRSLILKIIEEHRLDKNAVEQLALDRFGKGVRQLNKLEASGLIDELLEQVGQKPNNGRRFNRPAPARAA